jgi:predicted nucleic acid-binding protein
MTEIAFFDTNILLYTFDSRDPGKQEIARDLFSAHLESGTLAISTQVVQEFYTVATRKLNMPAGGAAVEAGALCELNMVVITAAEIRRAIHLEHRSRTSFWDALIVAAAESAKATVLYTEDLSHGQTIGAVRIVNPFLRRLQ